MKVFCVVTEVPGETKLIEGKGETRTELRRQEYRYAAETIEQVLDNINKLTYLPDEDLIAIYQEHPSIIIL